MAETVARNSYLQRLIGAAALDAAIYEEVEADRGATAQAMCTVVLASVALGLGSMRGVHPGGVSSGLLLHLAGLVTTALLSWAAWALVVLAVGTRVLPQAATRSDAGELLRTLGFSATPGLLGILAAAPVVAHTVLLGVTVWLLAAMVVAVRQALDFTSTWRAIVVCLTGWLLASVVAALLGALFPAPVRSSSAGAAQADARRLPVVLVRR